MNIVQVHLGNTFPNHLYDQLEQSRLFNPNTPVFLILSDEASMDRDRLRRLDVIVVRHKSILPCKNNIRFRRRNHFSKKSLGGFWLYTSERFYAIESFLEACRLEDVVHLENDVMLFTKLEEHLAAFRSACPAIGVTMDADTRCVPGIMYIRDLGALSRMNEFIIRNALRTTKNDMRAIAAFMNGATPGDCSALPVLPAGYRMMYPLVNSEGEKGTRSWFDEAFRIFGGVFDAAALGQYLGGIDAKISQGDTHGFISETAVYDPRNFNLHWKVESGLRRPYGTVGGLEFPVFNLHIHSKNLTEFSSVIHP